MSSSRINNKSEEDDEWLFDSILGFLSSPIWSIPIQHFLEINSSSNFPINIVRLNFILFF